MESPDGYVLKDCLYAFGPKFVYKANRAEDNLPVILKIISADIGSLTDILRLRNEYELLKDLNIPGVPSVIELKESHQGVAMIMEYFDGTTLREYLDQQTVSLSNFLIITQQLAELLAHLHRRHIIHKDVKPENVLINPGTHDLQLIDFSLAILLSHEKVDNVNHHELEGSLHYISPEQTGRMNRTVDYRTDFYSLGIMMHEMLGGKKPFESEDPMELLHAHLAKKPPLLRALRNEIPEVIENIILKLIEKAPENRYQNGLGLKEDISQCLDQLRLHNKIETFKIGEKDISDRFLISQRLYGREKESDTLIKAYHEISEGIPSLMLVSGFSGIGKSALIGEIHRPITEKRGNFISGKFEQFNKDIPYSAVIEAFIKAIQMILSEDDDIIQSWKERFTQALGDNGQIIINVIPQVELIMGKQPPVVDLPPQESQNRFNYLFLEFTQIFARKDHPMVLFLDDLQWADLPSLKLLELLLSEKENNYLLIIGAYRSNEVNETHPLLKTIESLKENNTKIQSIELGPLKDSDLNQLVADSLNCSVTEAEALSKLIMSKTGGNPFFANEFLKSLSFDKLISFSYATNKWEWDIENIKLRNITDNVADLMMRKIELLHPKAQLLCQYAACIGHKFDLNTLASINESSLSQTALDLLPAIQEGLILPVGNKYRLAEKLQSGDTLADVGYEFLHDQVQNAAYSLIDATSKQQLHLKIGTLMHKNLESGHPIGNIFDIVYQLNSAIPLLENASDRYQLAKLNLQAGVKAKNAAAYSPAYKYLRTGIDLLPEDTWESNYDLCLDLHNEGAEAAYLSSDFEAMEQIVKIILENTKDILDGVKAYIIKAQGYVSQTLNEEALNTANEMLQKLGVKFPSNPGKLNIISSLLLTKFKLRGKTKEQLLMLPEMNDPKQSAIMELLSTAASPAYFAKTDLFPLISFKQIHLSVKYGNHLHSGFAYSTYGLVMCGSTHEFDEGQKFGQLAVGLLQKFNADSVFAKIHFINSLSIRLWKVHYGEVQSELLEAYQKGLETGDFLFASYSAFNICAIGYYIGTPLNALKIQMDDYATSLIKIKQNLGLGWLNIFRQTVENLKDPDRISTELIGKDYDETIQKAVHIEGKDYSGLCTFYLNKMILAYAFEQSIMAVENGVQSMNLIDSILGTGHVPMVHYYYALSHLRLAGEDKSRRQKLIKNAKQSIKKIKMWAKTSPSNHLSKQYLLEAELHRVTGKTDTAESLYEKAILEAAKNKYLNEEALANELFARYFIEQKDETQFKKYIYQAKQMYIKWGALAKVNFLDDHYNLLQKSTAERVAGLSTSVSNPTTFNKIGVSGSELMDMESLNKAALAISSEIVLNNLLSKMMQIVIENAGARKGYMLINRNNIWYVEMEGISGKSNDEVFKAVELKDNAFVPESIINYVLRTKEDVVIDDVHKDQRFLLDDHFANDISVLCLPIINQGQIIAVLYATNSLHSGVFTQQRVQFLKLLSGQIAVSLQNALLFESLEQKVLDRTQELASEKKKSDDLLLNILPAEIADELKHNGAAEARQYNEVTVLFTDFIGFTKTSQKLTPKELVNELDTCFKAFDNIIEQYGLEKIKTIGDSYMAVCGLPILHADHAENALKAAIGIRDYVRQSNSPLAGKSGEEIRIGLHTGNVVAGIVGSKKFAFDIWGDTVNTASRMENNSEPGKINISGSTYQLVKDKFKCTHRGKIEAKHKGLIDMYFVEGIIPS